MLPAASSVMAVGAMRLVNGSWVVLVACPFGTIRTRGPLEGTFETLSRTYRSLFKSKAKPAGEVSVQVTPLAQVPREYGEAVVDEPLLLRAICTICGGMLMRGLCW